MNNMDVKQLTELKAHLETVVKETVNGKIDKVLEKIDSEAVLNKEHRDKMEPLYKAYETTNNFGKFVIWLSKIMLAIGIIIASIISLFKYFK